VDEIVVVYSDLTQLDGEPTNRATLRIECVPAGLNASEASAALVVAALAAMAAMACVAGIGIWIGASLGRSRSGAAVIRDGRRG
jgi:hypothetical protein